LAPPIYLQLHTESVPILSVRLALSLSKGQEEVYPELTEGNLLGSTNLSAIPNREHPDYIGKACPEFIERSRGSLS